MFNRFKKWTIKKLGGYTNDDFKKENKILFVETLNFKELKTNYAVPRHHCEMLSEVALKSMVKGKLIRDMAQAIEPFVTFEKHDTGEEKVIYTATLKIATKENKG